MYTYSTLLGLETSNKSAPLCHAFLKETLQLIILVPVEYLSFLPRYRLGASVQNVQRTMDLCTYVRTYMITFRSQERMGIYDYSMHTKLLCHAFEYHIITLFHHFQEALKLDANFKVEAWSCNIVKEILHPLALYRYSLNLLLLPGQDDIFGP